MKFKIGDFVVWEQNPWRCFQDSSSVPELVTKVGIKYLYTVSFIEREPFQRIPKNEFRLATPEEIAGAVAKRLKNENS